MKNSNVNIIQIQAVSIITFHVLSTTPNLA